MAKAKVDHELCIGCGTCESICPNVFKINNGKSEVVAEDCQGCNIEEVIESCPVGAISQE
jgi:ferredoxin